jgi:hypothetical protein
MAGVQSDICSFSCSNGATGAVKGFSMTTRMFVTRKIVSFYHDWTRDSTSVEDALAVLRREAMAFLDPGTLAAHKPSFATELQVRRAFVVQFVFHQVMHQAALEADGEFEVNTTDADFEALLDRICDELQHIFDYLEFNVYPNAERHFKFALGELVFELMGTNNISEAQNSRFDKFVGLSTSIKSLLALIRLGITYLRSAGNTYLVDTGVARKKRGDSSAATNGGQRRDISIRMVGWTLGATFQHMRRTRKGAAAVEEEIDVDLLAALESDE